MHSVASFIRFPGKENGLAWQSTDQGLPGDKIRTIPKAEGNRNPSRGDRHAEISSQWGASAGVWKPPGLHTELYLLQVSLWWELYWGRQRQMLALPQTASMPDRVTYSPKDQLGKSVY